MKRNIIIGCNILSGIVIAGVAGVWDALLLFLLTGRVPLFEYTVPPYTMLVLFVLFGIGAVSVSFMHLRHDEEATPPLPKRRYSRI